MSTMNYSLAPHYPCQNCTKRYLGCHGSCMAYRAVKAEHESTKEKIRAFNDEKDFAISENTRLRKYCANKRKAYA